MPAKRFMIVVFILMISKFVLAQDGAVQESQSGDAFSVILSEGKRLSSQGKYYDAAVLFNKVLQNAQEGSAPYQEALFELGQALYHLKLFVSSFIYFDRLAELGDQGIKFRDTLPWLVKIHRSLPGETASLFRMSTYPIEMYPPELKEEISFYVGQHLYYEGKLSEALETLNRVTSKDPELFVKAKYLKGVSYVRKRDYKSAIEEFNEILRFLRGGGSDIPEKNKYQEMTILTLARILYSMGEYEEAIRRYDLIPDTSERWLESLFEKSWAYFQIGNYARALGNLHTVNSPYFEEEYYPEAHVLKATIYFKTCHYEEALETVKPFYNEYYEILKELESVLTTYTDPERFYGYLATISVKGGQYSLKVKKIFNAAVSDKKVKRLFQFVVEVSKEQQRIEELAKNPVSKAMAEFLLSEIIPYKTIVIAEAGKLARERLTQMHKELKKLLSNALTIRLETLNAQKGILDEKLRKEQVVEDVTVSEKQEMIETDSEHLPWPFDGEYWRDEMGYYYHPLPSLCKSSK